MVRKTKLLLYPLFFIIYQNRSELLLRELIKYLNENFGVTFIICSHFLDELSKISTHLALISEGEIVYQSKIENVYNKFGNIENLYLHYAS